MPMPYFRLFLAFLLFYLLFSLIKISVNYDLIIRTKVAKILQEMQRVREFSAKPESFCKAIF